MLGETVGLVSILSYLFVLRLCSPSWPRIYPVDQIGLGLKDPPAPASQKLGLKDCTPTPGVARVYNPSL